MVAGGPVFFCGTGTANRWGRLARGVSAVSSPCLRVFLLASAESFQCPRLFEANLKGSAQRASDACMGGR